MVGNKFLMVLAGIVSAVVLTVGVVSATGGSSEQDVDPSPSATPDDSPTPTPEASSPETPEANDDADGNEGQDEADDNENDDGDACDSHDDDEDDGDDGDASNGNQKIAEAIAEEFDTTPEAVLAFHDRGIGFGALFKLYSIARAKGITVEELLTQIHEDGCGFAFGQLKKSLSEEEMAIFNDGPKNLGELVSGSNHEDDDGDDSDEAETEDAGEGETSRGGPPDHAKAKGHSEKD